MSPLTTLFDDSSANASMNAPVTRNTTSLAPRPSLRPILEGVQDREGFVPPQQPISPNYSDEGSAIDVSEYQGPRDVLSRYRVAAQRPTRRVTRAQTSEQTPQTSAIPRSQPQRAPMRPAAPAAAVPDRQRRPYYPTSRYYDSTDPDDRRLVLAQRESQGSSSSTNTSDEPHHMRTIVHEQPQLGSGDRNSSHLGNHIEPPSHHSNGHNRSEPRLGARRATTSDHFQNDWGNPSQMRDSHAADLASPQWNTRQGATSDHFQNDWENPSQMVDSAPADLSGPRWQTRNAATQDHFTHRNNWTSPTHQDDEPSPLEPPLRPRGTGFRDSGRTVILPYPHRSTEVRRRRRNDSPDSASDDEESSASSRNEIPHARPYPPGFHPPGPNDSGARLLSTFASYGWGPFASANPVPSESSGRGDGRRNRPMRLSDLLDPSDAPMGIPRKPTYKEGFDADETRPAPLSKEQMTKEMDCKICYEQLASVVVLPCGHAAFCKWCANQQFPANPADRTRLRESTTCPICRKKIKSRVSCHPQGSNESHVLTSFTAQYLLLLKPQPVGGSVPPILIRNRCYERMLAWRPIQEGFSFYAQLSMLWRHQYEHKNGGTKSRWPMNEADIR